MRELTAREVLSLCVVVLLQLVRVPCPHPLLNLWFEVDIDYVDSLISLATRHTGLGSLEVIRPQQYPCQMLHWTKPALDEVPLELPVSKKQWHEPLEKSQENMNETQNPVFSQRFHA